MQKIADTLGLRIVNDHEGDEHLNSPPATRRGGCEADGVVCNTEGKTPSRLSAYSPLTGGELEGKPTLNPLDILDYIYAVLHSPTYRETYKEFLKIDFPKVPYPTDTKKFWTLVTLGREIRLYHLLEHPNLAECDTQYPKAGSDIITTKIATKDFIVSNNNLNSR